jgi:hypothetical protein
VLLLLLLLLTPLLPQPPLRLRVRGPLRRRVLLRPERLQDPPLRRPRRLQRAQPLRRARRGRAIAVGAAGEGRSQVFQRPVGAGALF